MDEREAGLRDGRETTRGPGDGREAGPGDRREAGPGGVREAGPGDVDGREGLEGGGVSRSAMAVVRKAKHNRTSSNGLQK